ncbi:DUF4296 domain-containing protein [Hymenobacter sp. B81]|uniref:DUF4296 domain-containing protein n=1 Tax=Hymenobacter sp. B81 TaxID=3344878 RepID=UPI0037DD4383
MKPAAAAAPGWPEIGGEQAGITFAAVKNPLSALLLLLGLVLFSQCDRPEDPVPPARLLPRDQMVRVLIDLHLTESRVEASNLSPDSAKALFNQQLRDLYWRHKVEEKVFRDSYHYYGIHDKDLEEIYTTVLDSLKQREYRAGAK